MSSRPQRQTKPSQIIRDINADKAAAKPAAPRKAKAPAPAPAPAAEAAPVERMTALLAPPDMSGFRGLNLDLSTRSKEKDPKFNPSFNSYENPFWEKFITPADTITSRYMTATDELMDVLPATFLLVHDAPESFGVANLELKREYVKPIVSIPSYSKLNNKEYETQQTKSDENIAASIKFFRNQLPSFQQYQEDDDISWVVKEHRLLVIEIFEYYAEVAKAAKSAKAAKAAREARGAIDDVKEKKKMPSIATIKSRFNAITRIFRIAYQTKKYELYEKYSGLVIFLGMHFDLDEFKNELSDLEREKFVPFNQILDIQQKLQKEFELMVNKQTVKAYDINQELLLVSLYSLIPPLRNETKTLKFNSLTQTEGDWIVIKADGTVYLDLNEEKKRHDAILIKVSEKSPQLARIIKQSYELYPRTAVFTQLKKYPDVSKQASVSSLDDRLVKAFASTEKKVSVNSLRSSYFSYQNSEAIKNGKQLSTGEKDEIARQMRTSRKYLDEAYLKIFDTKQKDQQAERPVQIRVEPVDETTPYQKQLTRNQQYYHQNKEKVLEKQKAYKDSKSPFEKSRAKQLYYLNSDAEYYKKMKPATQEKYKFKKENGRWV